MADQFLNTYGYFVMAVILLVILIMFTSSQPTLIEKLKDMADVAYIERKEDADTELFYEQHYGIPPKSV